jgi:hypothetical protein
MVIVRFEAVSELASINRIGATTLHIDTQVLDDPRVMWPSHCYVMRNHFRNSYEC